MPKSKEEIDPYRLRPASNERAPNKRQIAWRAALSLRLMVGDFGSSLDLTCACCDEPELSEEQLTQVFRAPRV